MNWAASRGDVAEAAVYDRSCSCSVRAHAQVERAFVGGRQNLASCGSLAAKGLEPPSARDARDLGHAQPCLVRRVAQLQGEHVLVRARARMGGADAGIEGEGG